MDHFQRLYDTTVRTLDGLSGNGYGKEQDDRLRQEGTIATLNGEEVKWNKGDWVPTNEYKKPKKFERAADNITETVAHALNGDLGYRHLNTVRNEAVKMSAGAAHYVSTNVVEPLKTVSEDYGNGHYEPNGAGENLAVGIGSGLRLAEWGLDKAGDAGEYLGNHLDIDPRVSRFVAEEALTALATAGSSTVLKQGLKVANKLDNLIPPNTPRLVTAKGGAHVQIPTDVTSPQVMKAVTATDPEILKLGDVDTGDKIIGGEHGKWLARRNLEIQKRVDKLPSMRDELNEMIESGADLKEIKNFRKTIDDTKVMLHRKRSNVSLPTKEDPTWYQTTAGKRAKRQEELARGLETGEYLEAHHLFPKVLSAAFFDRMDWMINKGKAELDDLVLMNNIAIKLGRKPGDYKSGMLNMRKNPHNELHTAMDYALDEFNELEWSKKVNKAKNVDELLILWRDTIQDIVIPTAKDAESMNKLDETIKSVSSKFTGSKKPTKETFTKSLSHLSTSK